MSEPNCKNPYYYDPGTDEHRAGRPSPPAASDSHAATTPGPCMFPRCVKGEQPSYCGHDCDVREKPYEHEYGTPADGLAAIAREPISKDEEWALVQRMVGALVGKYGAKLSEETEEQARILVFVTLAGLRIEVV